MSYTKIEIDGKEVGLRFCYTSLRMFVEDSIKDAEEYFAGENLTDYGAAKIIQYGYKNDCKIKEVESVIPFEKFFNWVDDRMEGEKSGELAKVLTIWGQSRTTKSLSDNINTESDEEKKSQLPKIPPNISTPSSESPTGS